MSDFLFQNDSRLRDKKYLYSEKAKHKISFQKYQSGTNWLKVNQLDRQWVDQLKSQRGDAGGY